MGQGLVRKMCPWPWARREQEEGEERSGLVLCSPHSSLSLPLLPVCVRKRWSPSQARRRKEDAHTGVISCFLGLWPHDHPPQGKLKDQTTFAQERSPSP